MEPVLKIDPPAWLRSPELESLMGLIGEDQQSLLVGGCVRNLILQRSAQDIDVATKCRPDTVMEILQKADIKLIPTGIKHGTVTAVVGGRNYEITSLRQDVETDGRHANVSYTNDWKVDALRRDFTMNTLLLDMGGNIYDPLGNGVDDAKRGLVKFVGDPAQRIAEDYLRILRFFRFYAQYGQGEVDAEALKACKEASHHISTLSRERITSEFLKIISIDAPFKILEIMRDNNVLSDILNKVSEDLGLDNFCDLQIKQNQINLMARLFLISDYKTKFYDDLLRLTHAQKNFLVKLEMANNPVWYQNERALKKAIYHHGRDLMMQGYLLLIASHKISEEGALTNILKDWEVPECPITGEQLIEEGYVTGPDLGQELDRRKEEWLESVI